MEEMERISGFRSTFYADPWLSKHELVEKYSVYGALPIQVFSQGQIEKVLGRNNKEARVRHLLLYITYIIPPLFILLAVCLIQWPLRNFVTR